MSARISTALGFAGLLAIAACQKEAVQTYQVPKDNSASAAAPSPAEAANAAAPGPPGGTPTTGGDMTGTVPTASGAGLVWTAPSGWREYPPGPMRKANYKIEGPDGEAEVAITAFPGAVGGLLANVNRWRGQAGLADVDDASLPGTVTRLDVAGLQISVLDADGPAQHLLGAIVPLGDSTWFFKLTGPSAAVSRDKAAFLAFLRTLKPA